MRESLLVSLWIRRSARFGRRVKPGQLIHADKHGFLAVPEEDEAMLLDASRFMDSNECATLIAAAREAHGRTSEEILARLEAAAKRFAEETRKKFRKEGEW